MNSMSRSHSVSRRNFSRRISSSSYAALPLLLTNSSWSVRSRRQSSHMTAEYSSRNTRQYSVRSSVFPMPGPGEVTAVMLPGRTSFFSRGIYGMSILAASGSGSDSDELMRYIVSSLTSRLSLVSLSTSSWSEYLREPATHIVRRSISNSRCCVLGPQPERMLLRRSSFSYRNSVRSPMDASGVLPYSFSNSTEPTAYTSSLTFSALSPSMLSAEPRSISLT